MRRTLLLPFLVALLLPAAARAQDEQQAPRPVLPEIEPQEVEIRGQLEIAFPSLQRQPLLGFNPPPRVAPLPPGRLPYTERYKQRKVDLPLSPLRAPEAPRLGALASRTPRRAEVAGSAGLYLSRSARVRAEWPVSTAAAAALRLDYDGLEGHRPNENVRDLRTPYDRFDGSAGLHTRQPAFSAGAEVDGRYHRYQLYAAEGGGLPAFPFRTGTGAGVTTWLRSRGTSPLDGALRLRLGTLRLDTDDGGDASDRLVREEQRLDAAAQLAFPLRRDLEVRAQAQAGAASLDADGSTAHFAGGGSLFFRLSPRLDATVGLQALAFRTTEQQTDSPSDYGPAALYLSPMLRINAYVSPRLTVYARNTPSMDANGLAEVLATNPYVTARPLLHPTLRTVDAAVGARRYEGPFVLDARLGYVHAPHHLFFEHAGGGAGYTRGVSSVAYGRVGIARVEADASVALPQGFNASVGAALRRGRLLDDDVALPNFGALTGRGGLSYAFADGAGLLQATLTYESARERDRAATRRLGDYFDLDLMLSLNVTDAVGLVARLDNVSAGALERWDEYEQPPFLLMGGFRVLW